MSARPDASAPSASNVPGQGSAHGALSPKAAELGGLAAMRQTLNDFSLDNLSSLLDDELSLDSPASLASSALSQADATPSNAANPSVPEAPAPPPPSAPVATELVGTQLVGTQLVGTQIVATQPVATLPVDIASLNASAAQPPVAARRSSLDETQLYKSTPQPTIDLATVRRSASMPTQAFTGDLSSLTEAAATMPATVDPSRSSVPETTFWTRQDRDSALLEAMIEPAPGAALPEPAPMEASLAPEMTQALSIESAASAEPSTSAVVPEVVRESASMTTPRTIAQQLAGFFTGQPRRTTEAKWEQAVESDRRFTTMLLSDLDEALAPSPASDPSPSVPFDSSEASYVGTQVASTETPVPEGTFDRSEIVAEPVASASEPSPEAASALSAIEPQDPTGAPSLAAEHAATAGPRSRERFSEPSPEVRQLATYLLERSTPGVSTVVAVVGCQETRPGAEATLALAAAVADATGVSTLVVDGDFAGRDLSRAADAEEAPGFAEALVQSAARRSLAQSAGRDNLQLLPAGVATPDATEAPARVSAWIARAKQEHGLILVWLGSGGGDFERRLCGAADLALLLAAVDRDRPSKVEAAAERLRSVNARTLGVALVQA